jgi:hypothetical protein
LLRAKFTWFKFFTTTARITAVKKSCCGRQEAGNRKRITYTEFLTETSTKTATCSLNEDARIILKEYPVKCVPLRTVMNCDG